MCRFNVVILRGMGEDVMEVMEVVVDHRDVCDCD